MEFVGLLSTNCLFAFVSYPVFWLYFQAIFFIFSFIRWLQWICLFSSSPLHCKACILEWNGWYWNDFFSLSMLPEIYLTIFLFNSIYNELKRNFTNRKWELVHTFQLLIGCWQFLIVQHACNRSQYSKNYFCIKINAGL